MHAEERAIDFVYWKITVAAVNSSQSRTGNVAGGGRYCYLSNDLAKVQYHGNRFHVTVKVECGGTHAVTDQHRLS